MACCYFTMTPILTRSLRLLGRVTERLPRLVGVSLSPRFYRMEDVHSAVDQPCFRVDQGSQGAGEGSHLP